MAANAQHSKMNKEMGTGFNLKPVGCLVWVIIVGIAVVSFALGGVAAWLIGLID